MFNASKFKTTRHLMLNGPLPPKSTLISIIKNELRFDYSKVTKKLSRMASLKDRVVLAIFMHH